MIILRSLIVLIFSPLLTGCVLENVEKLKTDVRLLKSYLRAQPSPRDCGPPGTSQPMICNYRLIVKNISGDLFQGYVDPEVVRDGVTSCQNLFENKTYEDDTDMIYKGFKCLKEDNYRYFLYEFTIEGTKPSNGPVDLNNIPNTGKMKMGKILKEKVL